MTAGSTTSWRVIECRLPTSRSPASIAERPSPLLLASRSSTHPRGSRRNRGAARPAVEPARPSRAEAQLLPTPGRRVSSTTPSAPPAARSRRSPSSRPPGVPSIAATASSPSPAASHLPGAAVLPGSLARAASGAGAISSRWTVAAAAVDAAGTTAKAARAVAGSPPGQLRPGAAAIMPGGGPVAQR